MTTVVWVHGDCLSPLNPALADNPGAPALFVFDDALLSDWRIGLKRIVFLYECLLELLVTIRRGDAAEQVSAFAREHGATRVVTTESVSPRFAEICGALGKALPPECRLEIVAIEPFVDTRGPLDLRRFSRYWSGVKNLAMRKSGER